MVAHDCFLPPDTNTYFMFALDMHLRVASLAYASGKERRWNFFRDNARKTRSDTTFRGSSEVL